AMSPRWYGHHRPPPSKPRRRLKTSSTMGWTGPGMTPPSGGCVVGVVGVVVVGPDGWEVVVKGVVPDVEVDAVGGGAATSPPLPTTAWIWRVAGVRVTPWSRSTRPHAAPSSRNPNVVSHRCRKS